MAFLQEPQPVRPLLRRAAVIDKLIGDEVMAFFVPGISGREYRRNAVRAGLDLLSAVGYGSDTALGDPINVAARVQRCAGG